LEFADGDRNVFWLEELIEVPPDTELTVPESDGRKQIAQRSRQMSQKSVRAYHAIFQALEGQDDWISTPQLVRHLGGDFSYVSISYVLGIDKDKNQHRSMLALNLVERIKQRNKYFWRLTQYGRKHGKQVIQELTQVYM